MLQAVTASLHVAEPAVPFAVEAAAAVAVGVAAVVAGAAASSCRYRPGSYMEYLLWPGTAAQNFVALQSSLHCHPVTV